MNKDSGRKRADKPIIIINVNPEELFHKNDDEIKNLSDRLNKNLRLARSKKDDKSCVMIEKEICYVQREQNSRIKRKHTHDKFAKNRAKRN